MERNRNELQLWHGFGSNLAYGVRVRVLYDQNILALSTTSGSRITDGAPAVVQVGVGTGHGIDI